MDRSYQLQGRLRLGGLAVTRNVDTYRGQDSSTFSSWTAWSLKKSISSLDGGKVLFQWDPSNLAHKGRSNLDSIGATNMDSKTLIPDMLDSA